MSKEGSSVEEVIAPDTPRETSTVPSAYELPTIPADIRDAITSWMTSLPHEEQVAARNALVEFVNAVLDFPHPVGAVRWVHISQVQANDWNPNSVAGHEMKLLHTSISEDGYTMPVVTMWDEDSSKYVIIDGFHRYTTMKCYKDISETTGNYLPVVVIDKPIADRIASTVRHNRARGKHSVAGMSSLVFQMLAAGVSDPEICSKLGLEAEELARLKHITGYSKLYRDHEFSKVRQTESQLEAKVAYREEHPDEHIPQW